MKLGSIWLPRLALLGLAAGTACSDSSSSPSEATGVVLTAVDSGYDFSVFLTAPPGDTHRIMAVERGGRIWLTKDGIRQTTPFLDLSSLTGQGHEYGVYILAFHSQYAQNRRLFVYYVDNNANTRVAEFLANADFDSADPASQKIILGQAQSTTAVLYGGMIAFGTDGELYVGLGDGDVGGEPVSRAQDSTSLLGKILRLDVDGAAPNEIPADNPYVGRLGWRGEIWQLGLRNPWRWSFDRANGDFFIGAVGENLWEEINHLPAPIVGGNKLGWPIEEGENCFQPSTNCLTLGLVEPVFEYLHGLACAVTGGYVYRGQDFPELQGTYFYGDFCSGVIRSFKLDGEYPQELLPEIQIPLVNGKADNTVSFGEDGRGELYAVLASGRIYQIVVR